MPRQSKKEKVSSSSKLADEIALVPFGTENDLEIALTAKNKIDNVVEVIEIFEIEVAPAAEIVEEIDSPAPPSIDSLLHWASVIATDEVSRYKIYDSLISKIVASNGRQILTDINNLRTEYLLPSTAKTRKGEITKEIGTLFERFVAEVFSGCIAFKVVKNVQTTTNELDFILEITPYSTFVPFLRDVGSQVFGEAKCYTSGKINGNWVTKLSGVMETAEGKLGILIMANGSGGITNSRLRRKFEDCVVLKRVIVPLGQDFIARVLAGENILFVLEQKYNVMKRRELGSYSL